MIFFPVPEVSKKSGSGINEAQGGDLGKDHGIGQKQPEKSDLWGGQVLWEKNSCGDKTKDDPKIGENGSDDGLFADDAHRTKLEENMNTAWKMKWPDR